MIQQVDFLVIGGGIVGLATAMKLAKANLNSKVLVLEKEHEVAQHQTGHNSGVIHAGVYYAPGSLKADFCKRGVEATIEFCTCHQIPFEQCGKLLVATNEAELQRMEALYERCQQNDLNPLRLSQKELKIREPNVEGLAALFVETTGIADYPAMCRAMVSEIEGAGGKVRTGIEVIEISEGVDGVVVKSRDEAWHTDKLVVCAGLQADRLAKMAGLDVDFQIVPFRGEYYRLAAHHNDVVNHLIYPIPDPDLPFLGVHLTRMIDGSVTVGPNAVLGFAREGYTKGSVKLHDIRDMIGFVGFWKVLARNWRSGLKEFRNSMLKQGYLEECRKYCPSLKLADLEPYPAGIRAQAVLRDGTLVHDFLIKQTKRMIHVCNAPSPAATSALPIADHLVATMED